MLLKVEYRKHAYTCLEKIDVPLTTAKHVGEHVHVCSSRMRLNESWPLFRFSVAQRKGKAPPFLLLMLLCPLESQHEKDKLRGSIVELKTERGYSSLWNAFIPEGHLLKDSVIATSLKGRGGGWGGVGM